MTFAILVTTTPVTSVPSQSIIITYYDGQCAPGWLHEEKVNLDAPAKGAEYVDPGPYPYEFNLGEPLHVHLQIRHWLGRPAEGEENYLTIYLDGVPILEANTIGLDWYPGGEGMELIDLGTLPAGTHFINMSATSDGHYGLDWFIVLKLVEVTHEIFVGPTRFYFSTLSGSTFSNFVFDQTSPYEGWRGLISFDVTGPSSTKYHEDFDVVITTRTIGFYNITIPTDLMRGDPSWLILINGTSTPETLIIGEGNGTHIPIYFTYRHNAHIEISGTWVVPEFPTTLLLPLLIIVTLAAVILRKKLRSTKHRNTTSFS